MIKRNLMLLGSGVFASTMLASADAHANNFSSIASNIVTSIGSLPALLTALAYMFGLLLAVLGIMKIKDHVENPGQTPLKDGAIRLLAGGGLFSIPIVTQAMTNTVGSGAATATPTLTAISFNNAG